MDLVLVRILTLRLRFKNNEKAHKIKLNLYEKDNS